MTLPSILIYRYFRASYLVERRHLFFFWNQRFVFNQYFQVLILIQQAAWVAWCSWNGGGLEWNHKRTKETKGNWARTNTWRFHFQIHSQPKSMQEVHLESMNNKENKGKESSSPNPKEVEVLRDSLPQIPKRSRGIDFFEPRGLEFPWKYSPMEVLIIPMESSP